MNDRGRQPVNLGDIIRRQRELAALPLRQLAAMVGISNPYLSQIERGLRAPSEEVLHAIATSLQTSADALYQQAERTGGGRPAKPPVLAAIEEDPDLTARQRQILGEIYAALTEVTIARRRRGRAGAGADPATDDETADQAVAGGGAQAAADSNGPGTETGSGPVRLD